jgi:hypothetical protein
MLPDIGLFFYEKFEENEHPGQGGNIPVERHFPEGVGQTVHGIVQLVHQVTVDKGSVADHRNSFACECLRPSIIILMRVFCKLLDSFCR